MKAQKIQTQKNQKIFRSENKDGGFLKSKLVKKVLRKTLGTTLF
jgi:hypothetical protein